MMERFSRFPGYKVGLAFFGILLGAAIGVLSHDLPESTPLTRVKALWQPSFREARRGGEDLRRGDVNEAARCFDTAVGQARGSGVEWTLLAMIVDACERHGEWRLAQHYARLEMDERGRPADRLRYAESLMGENRMVEADRYLAPVLNSGKGLPRRSDGDLLGELAKRDEAYILATTGGDLTRARYLSETAIQQEMAGGARENVLAALNDTLAWVYFRQAQRDPGSGSLAAAQIYGETAAGLLNRETEPPIAAATLYHLSRIYDSEGMKSEAAAMLRSARTRGSATVRWLQAQEPAHQGRGNASANG
jgi:hypothetical protein